jgi:gluconolactonase
MSLLYSALDARFRELVLPNAELECLYEGGRWLEGPLWLPDSEQLLFSDIPNDQVLRWVPGIGVGVFSRGGFQNGRARDGQGRVVACEHGSRSLVARDLNGRVSVLTSHFQGKRLNSPNDVAVHGDGSIWFTDPDYGILTDYEGHRAQREQEGCWVFRLGAGEREPQAVVTAMTKPNGLAFSPDGCTLYVSESGGSHVPGTPPNIRRFAVRGAKLEPDGVLATLDCGLPDGMAVDEQGNLWSSAGDGVHCFAPDGTLLGKLALGGVASNLCFGGAKHDRLFITTARRLLCLAVAVRGARPLPGAAATGSLATP